MHVITCVDCLVLNDWVSRYLVIIWFAGGFVLGFAVFCVSVVFVGCLVVCVLTCCLPI